MSPYFQDELHGMMDCDFKPQDLTLGLWSAAVLVTQPRGAGEEGEREAEGGLDSWFEGGREGGESGGRGAAGWVEGGREAGPHTHTHFSVIA